MKRFSLNEIVGQGGFTFPRSASRAWLQRAWCGVLGMEEVGSPKCDVFDCSVGGLIPAIMNASYRYAIDAYVPNGKYSSDVERKLLAAQRAGYKYFVVEAGNMDNLKRVAYEIDCLRKGLTPDNAPLPVTTTTTTTTLAMTTTPIIKLKKKSNVCCGRRVTHLDPKTMWVCEKCKRRLAMSLKARRRRNISYFLKRHQQRPAKQCRNNLT